ncbi:MAG: sulfatase-like hydrolase/transferase [Bacteroidales bacterium]|nr:sulfatase-like hydrolase/transferase [Bacteroidales bacterium]
MVFNNAESSALHFFDWFKVIYHGFPLDLSAGAYLMAIPAILFLPAPWINTKYLLTIINIYVMVMLFIILFLGVVDMNIYSYWGSKLDITPFFYLRNTNEALASINILEIVLLSALFILLFLILRSLFKRLVAGKGRWDKQFNLKTSIIALIFSALLILPARGGVGLATLNPGSVYFHQNSFANHSATNVVWNMLYSVLERDKIMASHTFMDVETAIKLFNEIHQPTSSGVPQLVKDNANVLLIVLEGFSNKIIEPLGGLAGITPQLNKLCNEGLVFSNFFASGDRSDKGLVSIFSGFPSQPLSVIINYPSKTQHLPFLTDDFHNQGYQTAFYYGGNINFANFRSYFTRKSMDRIITADDFPGVIKKQKWGVPDEYVYSRLLRDLDISRDPFFYAIFTLSSHEPFDVPGEPMFGRANRDVMSKSGFYYSDRCLGAFIDAAKQKSWWDNTLIIILSDHGSRYPGNTTSYSREKFNIPMLWIGGAINTEHKRIETYGSQVDLAATVYNQFGFDAASFTYSKDLLDPKSKGYAYYAFNNGFGFYTSSAGMVYDNALGEFIQRSGTQVAQWHDHGKALLQLSTNDFIRK